MPELAPATPSQTAAIVTGHRTTVSIQQACELTGVSRRTIYNWLDKRRLEFVRTAGGSIRIFADTLYRDGAAAKPQ